MKLARSRACGCSGALVVRAADHVGGVREQQSRRLPFGPRRQHAAGVVEVQVRQHHDVDVLGLETRGRQRVEQHVALLDHAVALAQLRFEERADAGLEQHGLAIERAGQQRAAGQLDAVLRRRAATTSPTSRAARCRTSRRRRASGCCPSPTRVSSRLLPIAVNVPRLHASGPCARRTAALRGRTAIGPAAARIIRVRIRSMDAGAALSRP